MSTTFEMIVGLIAWASAPDAKVPNIAAAASVVAVMKVRIVIPIAAMEETAICRSETEKKFGSALATFNDRLGGDSVDSHVVSVVRSWRTRRAPLRTTDPLTTNCAARLH